MSIWKTIEWLSYAILFISITIAGYTLSELNRAAKPPLAELIISAIETGDWSEPVECFPSEETAKTICFKGTTNVTFADVYHSNNPSTVYIRDILPDSGDSNQQTPLTAPHPAPLAPQPPTHR